MSKQLIDVASSGDLKLFKDLLSEKKGFFQGFISKPVSIAFVDDNGNTALIAAATNDRSDIVDYIISNFRELTSTSSENANWIDYINLWQKNGHSALTTAAAQGFTGTVFKLLAAGAHLNPTGNNFFSALTRAVQFNHLDLAAKLLDNGADVNAIGGDFTALFIAATNGNIKMLEMLLSKGANINLSPQGKTPLMAAANIGNIEIVSKLLSRGISVNKFTDSGHYSALSFAAQKGYTEIVEILLNNGATINSTDATGATALMDAAKSGHAETVEKLLEKGADVNIIDHAGLTALMLASTDGNAAIIDILLQNGANANITDPNGNTALILAFNQDKMDAVKMLFRESKQDLTIEKHAIILRETLNYIIEDKDDNLFAEIMNKQFPNGARDCPDNLRKSLKDFFVKASAMFEFYAKLHLGLLKARDIEPKAPQIKKFPLLSNFYKKQDNLAKNIAKLPDDLKKEFLGYIASNPIEKTAAGSMQKHYQNSKSTKPTAHKNNKMH